MKTISPRITMRLRPAVRRLIILWILAVALAATRTISASYHARLMTGACWLALAWLSVYALGILRHLRQ